jgi:galactokinase/mevalonate kinase-like predicted kinase
MRSTTFDPDGFSDEDSGVRHLSCFYTDRHPILRHLPNVEPQHHFIVTHELPTRVGLGSSAALALAASDVRVALEMDRKATGAGWQDVMGCAYNGMMVLGKDTALACLDSTMRLVHPYILLFSTGGTHVESRNASALDPIIRALALAEARKLRDEPTLETLAWCMQSQWERRMARANPEACGAIEAVMRAGAMSAKTTGSRGAGFGVVLTKNREGARDMLVERGARVWLV